jgi:hypothetical protein
MEISCRISDDKAHLEVAEDTQVPEEEDRVLVLEALEKDQE